MKLILSALIACLLPLTSWGCYADLASYATSCPAQWTGGIGQAIVLKCPNITQGGVPIEVISCIPNNGVYPYDTPANICLFASTFALSSMMICPGGAPASKALPKIIPNQTACSAGSIIRSDTQVLSERIELVDVPFDLTYSSDRVKGRKEWYKTIIPITSSSFTGHTSIDSVDLSVSIAGQNFSQSFPPSANQKHNFVWDGKDGSGNPISGSHEAIISVTEKYNIPMIAVGALTPPAFANLAPANYVLPPTHSTKTALVKLGSIFNGNTGFGGWDISIRHYYDPDRDTLYLGDGSQFSANDIFKSNGDRWVVSSDRSEVYVFDSSFRHIETKDALFGNTLYTFNYSSGRLISVNDKYGNQTSFQYSGAKLTSITSHFGHVTHITTCTDGYIDTVSNPANETYWMSYSPDGLLLTFEKPSGTKSTMTYDSAGLLLSDSSDAGSSISLARLELGNGFKITETSAVGRTRVSTMTVGATSYNRSELNSNGKSKNYSMDLVTKNSSTFGSGISSYSESTTTDPRFPGHLMPNSFVKSDGATKNVTFTESATLSSSSDPFSFTTLTKTWVSGGKTNSSTYNVSANTISSSTPMGKTSIAMLNSNKDITSLQLANLSSLTFSRDTSGRISKIAQGTRDTNFTYDSTSGFLSSVENALGQKTSFTRDLVGRVLTQILPDLRVISFAYDSNGNVTSITPPNKPSHTMSYNGFDYIDTYVPPTVQAPNNVTTTYAYSNDRELTHIYRPDGQVVEYNYDTQGNLGSIDLPTGTRTFSFSSGNLSSSVSEDFFTRNFSFSQSRIPFESVVATGLFYYMDNSFNSELLPSNETLNINSVNYPVNYTYDNDNFLTSAGNANYTRATSTGALVKFSLDNLEQQFTYSNNFDELSSIDSIYNGSTTTYEASFLRDDLGRIYEKTEQYAGGSSKVYKYIYDVAGRLTDVTLNGNPNQSYIYDTNSNRISHTVGSTTINPTYDEQDRLLTFGTKSFTYNMNGEVTSVTDSATSTTINYSYDVLGNLKSVTLPSKTVNYKVDAHNRRMKKLSGTTTENFFVWSSYNQLIGITDNTGALAARFIYGSKQHVPDYMVIGSNRYQLVTDHLGSPVQVINSSTGVVAQEIKYDLWGSIITDSNPGFTPFGFAGCLYDQDTKLCRFGARDYDASIGRWLSKDPILFGGGDTNLYGYVMQDPVNYIDIEGTSMRKAEDGGGGAGGGGGGVSPSAGQLKQFQKQFDLKGKESLLKSKKSFMERYEEHVIKIKNATSYTSSMEKENRNFQQQMNAIDEILKRNGSGQCPPK